MILQLQNGTQLDIENYSLKRLFHRIPSVSINHVTENVDGMDGSLFLESSFGDRVISVELLYISQDIFDFYLIRDEVNALFARKESFYIIFKNEPYKRYKVRLNSAFELEPNQFMNSFVVEFICENIFAESIGTSLQVADKTWDSGVHAWNNSITWDDTLSYTFNSSNFNVKNLGNVVIDPRQHELEITLRGSFSSNVTIRNVTTGDIYTYSGSLATSDTLVLKGVQSFKNGASVFRNTNKRLLTLAVGDNNFVIEGGTVSSISFNFRFLYL